MVLKSPFVYACVQNHKSSKVVHDGKGSSSAGRLVVEISYSGSVCLMDRLTD